MIYGSVCSGIEAATVAWHDIKKSDGTPVGWKPAFFSDIEKFPRAVLAHHYPTVPCHGDFTTIGENEYAPIDLLVGGTPCQSFSIAGLRKGLDDDRGNLALEFIRLAKRLRPRWILWENVPGVLSSNKGRDFGSFLGGLAECGYGFAYRVLDAQYFGAPQRRRRVFVVGYLGDWRRAAAVLFERESLQGDITPIQGNRTIRGRNKTTFGCFDTRGVNAFDRADLDNILFFPVPRRPTPLEVERSFGFSDDYTKINEKTADGPRYKALGNSMAVPVMRWLGERIQMVDDITVDNNPNFCTHADVNGKDVKSPE